MPGPAIRSQGHAARRLAARGALAAGALALALGSGCASYGPAGLAPGASSAEAIAEMGPPKARFATPAGGERLEFWRGPFGKHTYMLEFDARDRLLGWEQVLTESNLRSLRDGMTKDELLYRIGHPSEVQYLARLRHQLWSYRYVSPFCHWFQVSLDDQDRVVSFGDGPDPMCTVPF